MSFANEEFPFTSEYDSDLRAVLKYIRKIKELVASYDDIIAELRQELANIQGLYDRVDALERATADLAEIRTNISTLEKNLQALTNKEKADIDELKRQVDALKDTMEAFTADVRDVYSYVNHNIAVLDNKIDRQRLDLMRLINDIRVALEQQIEYILWRLDQIDTSVINPWHTQEGRISQDRNAKHIYADLADECLTAEEYSRFGLTADGYSEFGITARQYAKNGKECLHYYWVYSPVHGWRQDINVVLTDIVGDYEHTMTAIRYAELGLTADEYSAIGLTAKAYYGYNPDRVGIYVEDGVMQSDQYYIQVIDGVVQFTGVEASVEDGMLSFD